MKLVSGGVKGLYEGEGPQCGSLCTLGRDPIIIGQSGDTCGDVKGGLARPGPQSEWQASGNIAK